ncbi:glutamyl-tRNA(Gln) amidotransferase subunit A [Striga asiatica]|uniref:Glutamyl-tRNA(Gln) amidotransferase subunit A n=1 Tax=Striga asiatica TaxID=4170 RepID=A0A5A7PJX9_STRAF|nr:glutamyl-tRNA(Gln) amidotransferase subunit A [Striga asiatica]
MLLYDFRLLFCSNQDDGILVIPTSFDPPAKLGAKEISTEDYVIRTSSLSSLASMSGCCQVNVPSLFPCTLASELADAAVKPKSSSNAVTQETSAEMAKEKGNQAFKGKQWQRAIGFYTEAIKLNSNNATYYSNRAAAYLEIGSFIQAEADCTQAVDLDKKNVKAYLRRGTAREMLSYYKEAMEGESTSLLVY